MEPGPGTVDPATLPVRPDPEDGAPAWSEGHPLSEAVNQLNAFLGSVLASLTSGAVVVNEDLNVLMWNERAYDLWGLSAEDVKGKSILNLDIGLPVAELRGAIRSVLAGESERKELTVDAVNRRGKKIRCKVSCTPLVTAAKKREGAIVMMEQAP